MPGDAAGTAQLRVGISLHIRPAGLVVQEACRYAASITVRAGARQANAKSILELVALGALGGTTLAIEASGPDAAVAVAAISALISGL